MPDNIVGFSIKKEVAKENVKGWLSKLWFAQNSIKSFASTSSMHELKGCYMPFWYFDANTQINYSGERGQYRYESRTREVDGKQESYQERVVDWYPVFGNFNDSYKNEIELAQTTLPQNLVDDLGPWKFNKAVKFEEKFLSGFETLLAKNSWVEVQKRIDVDLREKTKRLIGGNEQRITFMNVNYSNEQYNQISLPIWIGAYKFNDKTYRICINGQTGKIDGERPYSAIKIALFSLALIVAGFGIYYLSHMKH
jgi:hypothetical protein